MTAPSLAEDIAAALEAHQIAGNGMCWRFADDSRSQIESCGWMAERGAAVPSFGEQYRAHVAAVLADVVRVHVDNKVAEARIDAWDKGWRIGASGRNLCNPYRLPASPAPVSTDTPGHHTDGDE